MMNLFEKVNQLGDFHGIDFIGVAGIESYKKEISSIGGYIANDYPRALSIGIALPVSIIRLLENSDIYENILQYKTHAYDVINDRLDQFSSIISSVIQKNGHHVMPLPAAERIDNTRVCASVSHKLIARLAGFGWIGKNCLLINPAYGPAVRWTTVLTDAPFKENKTIMDNRCGSCTQCTNSCPAKAIRGRLFSEEESREQRLDVNKCERYFEKLKISNKLQVCGMCISACPHLKKAGI
jgi:epoxyqueuosine reductase